jgi:hypothetical protein
VPGIHSVERDLEFRGEFHWVEGTAGEVAVAHLERGDFSFSLIGLDYDLLGVGILFDIS